MTQPSSAFDLSAKRSWLLRGLPWFILASGVLLVLVSWYDMRDKTIKQQQIEFNLLFDRFTLSIENQLKANEQVLRGVVGLFNASNKVDGNEFRAYVAALKLEELHPGILGVGFSQLIDPKDLLKHVKSMRAEGVPDFSINPPGQRDIYTSIIYLEPFNWRNQRAFGYDMYSEPIRQKAMIRARDTGLAALTGKVTLVQEVEKDMQAGVLLYVPIYQHNAKGEGNRLIGWAYSPLRMKDLMIRLMDREHPDFAGLIAIAVHDGAAPEPASLLFESLSTNAGLKRFHLTRQIELAGQVWTVSANALPGFVDKGITRENAILIAGLVVTVLLASLVGTFSRGHERMAAAGMILRQFKAIVDFSSDAIISKMLDGTITSWNHGAESIFGYRAEEVIGQSIQILIPLAYQNEELEILARILRGERVEPFETVRKHKDGRLIDISATISPLMDNTGKVVGSSKIARDITERKQTERRLKESEERLTLATIHNGVGIWDWDLQTLELIWDESMFSLYHLHREDFSGAVEAWEKSLHPDDRNRCVQETQAALSGEKAFDTDYRVIWPNGEIHYIKAVAKVFRDQSGLPLRMLGTNIDITQTKMVEDQLRDREEQLRMVLEGADLGYWDWNMITGQVERNEQWAKILGYSYAEIRQTTQQWADFIHPDDREIAWQSIYDVIEGRSAAHKLEYRMLHKDGGYRWILDQAKVMQRNADGKPIRMSGTHSDITERKQADLKLQMAANVFKYAREGITITDTAAKILEVNDTFTHITGYSREEALGQNPRILQSGRHTPEFFAAMWDALSKQGYWSGEIWNRRKSGEVYAELITISAVQDAAGKTQNYLGLFTDITQMKEHQQQLEHLAHYDPLTGLPNRVLLADRVQQVMIQNERRGQSLAIVYLDLDGFKVVNDTYGHQVGDELLIVISRRMKEVLRDGDTLARIGGDEFVVVLVDLPKKSDYEPVLLRLLQMVAEPVVVENAVLQVSASIGITLYPHDNADADQLMRHADQAMYVAKQAGKNRYHLFDVEHDTAQQNQQMLIEQIRLALEQGEFLLYYQPKVNMRTGEVVGAEALIRWRHSQRGLLLPGDFLSMIENLTISEQLDEWVIDTALAQISHWQNQGLKIRVSVNIGARQLQQANFLDRLKALLSAHPDVQPEQLELEILETNALDDIGRVSKLMYACREMSLHFALDDFGAGYSSLTYLRHLPADTLKIDRSFVRDMLDDPDDLAIVQGVVGLAKAFGRTVIAEGVENIAHRELLISIGCELAQGYAIARPMPAHEMPEWVISWRQNAKDWKS